MAHSLLREHGSNRSFLARSLLREHGSNRKLWENRFGGFGIQVADTQDAYLRTRTAGNLTTTRGADPRVLRNKSGKQDTRAEEVRFRFLAQTAAFGS